MLVPFVLLGCQSTYTIAVKNTTDQPVTLTVVERLGSRPATVRASKWLGPGDAARLGPGVSSADARLELVADSKANNFAPPITPIEPGWTAYDITRNEVGRLKLVRRNQQ